MAEQLYLRSLVDPFDRTIEQPKILDGRVPRSAGLRLRRNGKYTCNLVGWSNWFLLHPGFHNCLSTNGWDPALNSGAGGNVPNGAEWTFSNHTGTSATERGYINRMRTVSCGMRLSLQNATDQDEGYFEAIRIPSGQAGFLTTVGSTSMYYTIDTTHASWTELTTSELSDRPSYITGKLKDIERIYFKTNAYGVDHDFLSPTSLDGNHDLVIVRVFGRVAASNPTILQVETCCNQEIVYKDTVSQSRLLTNNIAHPANEALMQRAKVASPALRRV
jgi:hypothetical protein